MIIEATEFDTRKLAWLLEERGKPTSSMPVSNQTIQKWQGRVPHHLLYLWQELGWCSFHNGLLWLVNPDDYAGIVADWLADTELDGLDIFHCFARTAFGKLFIHGEKSGVLISIYPHSSRISMWKEDFIEIKSYPEEERDSHIATSLSMDNKSYDMYDSHDHLLFHQALERLGQLKSDEMYAFVPFKQLLPDGKAIVDSLKKVRLDVQLSMLRQFFSPFIAKI